MAKSQKIVKGLQTAENCAENYKINGDFSSLGRKNPTHAHRFTMVVNEFGRVAQSSQVLGHIRLA